MKGEDKGGKWKGKAYECQGEVDAQLWTGYMKLLRSSLIGRRACQCSDFLSESDVQGCHPAAFLVREGRVWGRGKENKDPVPAS
jgi:hypothetical protein